MIRLLISIALVALLTVAAVQAQATTPRAYLPSIRGSNTALDTTPTVLVPPTETPGATRTPR